MPSIIQVLTSLNVNKTTTQQIEQIENFYKNNKSCFLKDLLNNSLDDESFNSNSIFNQLKKTLESVNSFSQNPDNAELEIIKNTLQKKIKEIGQENLINKAEILDSLKKALTELSGFVRQTQTIKTDEKRKAAYDQAKKTISHTEQEVLKSNIKKNKNLNDIAELYKSINPNIISLTRFFSLKEEIFKTEKEYQNNLTILLDFLKDKLNLPIENIKLADLEKITEWSKFKVSLQTKFEKSKRKNDASLTSVSEQNSPHTSDDSQRLFEENQQLIKEIAELKEKISFLEKSITNDSIKENPLTHGENKSEDLAIAELHSLKAQDTATINKLNLQLSQITDKNEHLTTEMGTHKELNEKQHQIILNLNAELANVKIALETKEKQVAENSTKLKHQEEQLNLKEQELLQNKFVLEKSSAKINQLSEDITNTSKKLDEKNKSINQKESELINLNVEKHQLELQIQNLKDALQDKKYKEEELLKLTKQLNQLKAQFKQDNDNLTSNSHSNNQKISLLRSDINEKELSLEKLKNELDGSKKIVTQYKQQINNLNTDLESKEQELNESKSQLQTLTKQSKDLNIQKDILEQKYKTELADSLDKYRALQAQLLTTTQDLGEKLTDLQKKNISSGKENGVLKENLESLKMSLEKEKDALLTAEKEISELKNALSSNQFDLTSITQDFKSQLEFIKKEKEKDLKQYDLFISEIDKVLFSTENPTLFSEQFEEFNQILKKLQTLKKQVNKNESLEDENNQLANEISHLKFTSDALESETIKKLINEQHILEEQVLYLETQLLKMEQFKNDDQAYTTNASLEFEFDDEKDEEDEAVFTKSASASEPNAELDPYILFAKQLESTQRLLSAKEKELLQKNEEFEQLQNQLSAKDTEVKNLKIKAQKETDDLATQKTETQQRLKESQDHIACLTTEQIELMKKDATNRQTIAKQIEELDKLKLHYENSIQEFDNQITYKETYLKDLSTKLNAADQQVQQLKKTINSTETEKLTLKNKLDELEQKNHELQQKLNQTSVKDTRLSELEQEKILNEEKLQIFQHKLKNLEKELENSQMAYSESNAKYVKLKNAFEEQSQELNLKSIDRERSYVQLEGTHTALENLKTTTTDARQLIQDELSSSKKEGKSMKDGELNPQFGKPYVQGDLESYPDPTRFTTPSFKHSDSSSGHSSLASSIHDLNDDEDLTGLSASQEKIPQQPSSSDEAFSDGSSSASQSQYRSASPKHPQSEPNLQFTDGEDSILSEAEDGLTKSTDLRPSMPDKISIPISEQQDRVATLEEVIRGVNAAFKQENHPAIIEALINNFLQIATDSANHLLKDNVKQTLSNFEPELKKTASNQIIKLVFPYINSQDYKTQISTTIQRDKLKVSNYLEAIISLTETIFDDLKIKESNQSYKDNIADQGKNLLFKLCTEKLQTSEKEKLVKLAKESLKSQAFENGIQPTKYTEIIQKTAEELVAELLETNNLLKVLKETSNQSFAEATLLVASQQRLQDQLVQQIKHNFVYYFPNLHLDPILKKINDGKALSDEEIARVPVELQYAVNIVEFVSGLRVKYPNLSPLYKINEDAFKQLRLILRKNALNDLTLAAEDPEIIDLSTKNWLEKKLQHITKKSISLKLDKKDQKDLDNNFQKYFTLSTLEDMAITHKSIDELKNELKKLHDFKLKTVTELSKTFSGIEQKLLVYPNLITEDGTFQANLNNSLPLNFPNLSAAQIQMLLDKINHHLENDVSKWRLLNNDKIAQEIANAIISDPTNNPFELDTDIKKLVSDSLTILYKFHDLQETVEKRKHWNLEIQQLYALTQKLKSSSHFNQTLEDRICKLEEMLYLKKNDADENVKALPKGVYLPHKCRVIPNFEFDSTDSDEYHLHVGDFYKQEALKVGNTITFSQKLSNEDQCKWSATLNTDKCLSFKTQKKRFRREKSYLHEVSFAQMVYSVNSFKDAKTCTLNFGNCSQNMKERLYLFAKAYNELRVEESELQKRPKINCNIKNPPNLDNSKIAAVKEEIKAQLNLYTHELEDISTKLKDDTMRPKIIR